MAPAPTEEQMADLFNVIEELRRLGVDDIIKLPQIVACGDQSAGKSSTFQALSGAPFPVGSGLCTRHPTRLVMRHGDEDSIDATIEYAPTTNEALAAFHETSTDLNDLPSIITKASQHLKLGDGPGLRHFCDDILHLEICGPHGLNLSLLDLPGTFSNSKRDTKTGRYIQTEEDLRFVEQLVKSHVENDSAIVLAVVPGSEEIVNSSCLKFLREQTRVQPDDVVGVLTKPDTGTVQTQAGIRDDIMRDMYDDKAAVWCFIQNGGVEQVIESYDDFTKAMIERNLLEFQYFSKEEWRAVPERMKGIESLKALLRARQ